MNANFLNFVGRRGQFFFFPHKDISYAPPCETEGSWIYNLLLINKINLVENMFLHFNVN